MTAKIRIAKNLYEDTAFHAFGPGLFPNQEVHISGKYFEDESDSYVLTISGPNIPSCEWVTAEVTKQPDGQYLTEWKVVEAPKEEK